MPNKLVGKLYEKRGDDILRVYTSESGDVVQIDQHIEGSAFRVISIDFWKETAPELVKLIQEAAGIEPEYEYAVQGTHIEKGFTYTEVWHSTLQRAEHFLESFQREPRMFGMNTRTADFENFRIVKRRKAGPVEDA